MKVLSWINVMLGLWLIMAGFALSRVTRPAMVEEIALGLVIVCLATVSAVRPSSMMSWFVAMAGLWTLIAPIAIDYAGASASRRNDIAVGIAVLVLGVANSVYRQVAATPTNA
jgi:hypothetical protein